MRAGALGDVLLLRRAVTALKERGARVRLVAPAAGSALVGSGISEVDALLPWEGVDMAGLLAGCPTPNALTAALAAADLVVAYTRSADLRSALRAATGRLVAQDPVPVSEKTHASLWLARPLAALGLTTFREPSPLAFSPAEHASASRILGTLPDHFLALHPGSGSPRKNWPQPSFAALADRLAGGRPWLLVLGPADDPSPWQDVDRATVAQGLPLRTLGAVLSRAGLFVGNDSGPAHLAAAAGAPVLVLFGPTDPLVWAPLGPHVRTLRAPAGQLSALPLDEVSRVAEAMLLTSAASGPPSG